MTKNLAASVHQRLLNRATAAQRPFDELLQYFGMERFLYRLGRSVYADQFVLKGALMFSVWQGPFARPTRDIDLSGRTANTVENLVAIVKAICLDSSAGEEGVEFLAGTVSGEPIIEGADYEGVRVSLTAKLGNARIVFHIDIGFGDPITPGPVPVQLPTLLDFPPPILRGYNRETSIAEKYHAMVYHGELNSRWKDFYDVWRLAEKFEFDGVTLAQAIRATFQWRNTDLVVVPVALSVEFANNAARQKGWTTFLKRSQINDASPMFSAIVDALRLFLPPVTCALIDHQAFEQRWLPGGPWRVPTGYA
jgi:hypothetical protein